MSWIDVLQYAATGLAALFGFWAAVTIRRAGHALDQKDLAHRLMIFSVALLLLSGLLAAYEGYFAQGSRLSSIGKIVSRMDRVVGNKLDIDNDAFVQMDAHTRQIMDNVLRQLCQDIIDIGKTALSNGAPSCRARIERPPIDRGA